MPPSHPRLQPADVAVAAAARHRPAGGAGRAALLDALQLERLDWFDLPGMADGAGYQRKAQLDTVELTLPPPPVVVPEPAPAPAPASGYRLPLRMPMAWVVQSQRTLGEDEAASATAEPEDAEPATDPATLTPTPADATRAIQAQRQQTARHAWARLQVPLRQALDPRADTPWSLPIDWRAATERVARSRHLWPLPRRTQVRWPGGCVVLLDTQAPSLQPLRGEIDSIATRLRRSIGGRGAVPVLELEPASSVAEPVAVRTLPARDWLRDPDLLHLPDLDELDAQPLPWHRWNGRTVVVISDLGAHERDTARRALWAARVRQALQNGVQLRALVPCAAPGLAHLPKALSWAPWPALQRGRRVAAVSPEAPRLQTLLALLGFCGDASEPLLRGLVQLVSPGAEEAGWLWRLWNHDDVQRLKGGHCRLVDENGRAKPHLARIRHLPVNLLHAAFWLRRLLRAGLSPEDEHAAVLRAAELAPQLRDHDPELRLLRTAARRYLLHDLPQQLHDATGAERQRRGACAVVWVEKVAPVAKGDRRCFQALQRVRSLAHEGALKRGEQIAPHAELGEVQPLAESPRADELRSWLLVQHGRELVLCDQLAEGPQVILASVGPAPRSEGVWVRIGTLEHWLPLDADEVVVARWDGAAAAVHLQLGSHELELVTAQRPRGASGWRAEQSGVTVQVALPWGDEVQFPWGGHTSAAEDFGGTVGGYRCGMDDFGVYLDLDVGGVEQRLRWIEPGSFWMGSTPQERARLDEAIRKLVDDESPRHRVMLTAGYWLADTPCVQGLWEAVMGENPSRFNGERDSAQRPVERVSWGRVQEFLKALNQRLPAGCEAVLPTEAQWEYAARAGTNSAYWWGDEADGSKANWNRERESTTAVKSYAANPWGLYDVHGNVLEWCAGSRRDYGDKEEIDPPDGQDGDLRALRGGSWSNSPGSARAAYRRQLHRGFDWYGNGFRFALRSKSQGWGGSGAAESPEGGVLGGPGRPDAPPGGKPGGAAQAPQGLWQRVKQLFSGDGSNGWRKKS